MLDAVMRVLAGGEAEKASGWSACRSSAGSRPISRRSACRATIQPRVISLRDLTEAHRVERMRVDFVANASHELRTPLASLLGFVETLQGPAQERRRRRATNF